MTHHKPAQPSPPRRRFDVTLAGDTNLDLVLYGLPDDLPAERELLADKIAIRRNRGIVAGELLEAHVAINWISTP